jgi:hypothetical protein
MRKRRTRGHIIEDLGFNHVERQVLLAGYTVQEITQDYGYDGFIQTFEDNGEVESGYIFFQLKSTDNLKSSSDNVSFVFDLSVRDLELWLVSVTFMVLILYDAKENQAFFIDLNKYFQKNSESLVNIRKFVRIYIPKDNLLDSNTVKNLRIYKNLYHGKTKNV